LTGEAEGSTNLKTVDVDDPREWRSWLLKHHEDGGVWLVFHKGGLPSMTYEEAVDEALCFGWIDSVIRRIDDGSYVRRFTPRRAGSAWSTSNLERLARLRKEGRMTEWGAGGVSEAHEGERFACN
jgi:uncharacterized protein YdeI (YjbR/CyaY-like superfamily)